jgi:hypothetical protein
MTERRNAIRWSSAFSSATERDFEKVEATFGVSLPSQLREIILRQNNGSPSPDVFDLPEGGDSVFDSLLSFREGDPEYIVDYFESMRDILPSLIFPFAYDPSGNLLCLRYESSRQRPSVVFWDHELADTSPEEAITELADSFDELLASLHESAD